jgi:type IV secretion system protein TrbL
MTVRIRVTKKLIRNARRALVVTAGVFIPTLIWADTAPSAILGQYSLLRGNWIAAVATPARDLFGLLALIEFAWTAAVLLLEKSDLQSWTAGVVRKLMWIGAFYTLLIYGPTWIPAIVDSFITLGTNAAGTGPLAPGDVYARGLEITGNLLKGSSDAGFLTNFGSALSLVLAAFLVFFAFLVITVQFVVALVESYIVVSAGFIFLGFGGSRWTAPYVERYIGLAVSVGIKIMIQYLLIGSGMALSAGWLTAAVQVPGAASPSMSALDIVGSALIYTAICWQAPKVIAGVIGGSPALSGGDLISTMATLATAVYFAASTAVKGGRAVVGTVAAGLFGGSSTDSKGPGGPSGPSSGGPSGGSGGSGGNSPLGSSPQPQPPAFSAAPHGASNSSQVSPPVAAAFGPRSSGADTQGSSAATSDSVPKGQSITSYAKTAAVARAVLPPSDAAPHTPPPSMSFGREGAED